MLIGRGFLPGLGSHLLSIFQECPSLIAGCSYKSLSATTAPNSIMPTTATRAKQKIILLIKSTRRERDIVDIS